MAFITVGLLGLALATLIHLIEWREAQYSRGEPFNQKVVWELAARAAEAEQRTGR